MNEVSYWAALEFRVCRELSAMSDKRLFWFWCDGFMPSEYYLNELPPRITGQVWICLAQMQEQWPFILFFKSSASTPNEINWRSLLPSEDKTGWLTIDKTTRYLRIELL
jgi:hypothetical protein